MKKLSEIIKLAMPAYQGRIDRRLERGGSLYTGPGFCYAVSEIAESGLISPQEHAFFDDMVYKKINNHGFLANHLRAQKKGASWWHRVAYYKRWIAQLEKKGL